MVFSPVEEPDSENVNPLPQLSLVGSPAGENYEYTIHNPYIVTSNYVLDHKLHQLLGQQYCSEHGLHYEYKTYTHIRYDIPEVVAFTQEIVVHQSFSRATKALFVMDGIYDDGDESSFWNAQFDNVRQIQLDGWSFGELRARIGDTVYPDTPVKTWREAYHLFRTAWKIHRGGRVSTTSFLDFKEMRLLLVDLCRGVMGKKSGQVINNHYPLVVTFQTDDEIARESVNTQFLPTAGDPIPAQVFQRRLHCFVEHERILMARKANGVPEHIVVA